MWQTDNQVERHQVIKQYFEFRANQFCNSVAVAGEFNGWKPLLQMQKQGDKWRAEMQVDQSLMNKKIQYKFVEDGSNWKINPDLPRIRDMGGNENNYFEIKSGREESIMSKKFNNLRVPRMILN